MSKYSQLQRLALGSFPTRKHSLLFWYATALLVLFSLTVSLRWWTSFDLGLLVLLEDLTPRSLDPALSVFSLLGSAEVTGLTVLAFAYFCCPPSSRVRLVVLFALTAFLEWIGKNVVYQPGPPDIYYRYVFPFSLPTSGVDTPFSFPSGHSARTVFVALVIGWWIWHRRTSATGKWLLYGILSFGELVMLVSRVTLGEHWPSDVVGGALLAALLVSIWWYSTDTTWVVPDTVAQGLIRKRP